MKKAISVLLCVFTLIFVFSTVSAASGNTVDGIKFVLPSGFSLYSGSDLGSVLGTDGLRFAAISSDRSGQIQMRCTDDEFAKSIGSFYGLDGETIDPVGKKLFENDYSAVTLNSMAYIKKNYDYGSDRVVMYVTVYKGKLYTFAYFGSDPSDMGEFMGTVGFPQEKNSSALKTVIIAVAVFFILVDIVFAAWLISSLYKDYRRYKIAKSENIVSQYIKIKRRKY